MSRFVAGFIALLYVSVVAGQQYPGIRLKGTGDEPSISIDHISGGSYPAGSYSIGYGNGNQNGNGKPGVDIGVNGANGQIDSNNGLGGQGQNGGGYVNGQNDIGGYGNQNGYNGQNGGVPIQNDPGQHPPNSYEDNYIEPTTHVPVKNSAPRINFFARLWRYIFSWF